MPTARETFTPSARERLRLLREGYATLMREFDCFDRTLETLCATSSSGSLETPSTSLSSSPLAMPSEATA